MNFDDIYYWSPTQIIVREIYYLQPKNFHLHKKAKVKFIVEFKVLTAVVMKSLFQINMLPPCSACYLLHFGFLLGLFDAEGEGNITPKYRLICNGLHTVTYQKIELF
jgi:hypothetical protein